jgi:flavorubredoxin
MNEPFQAVKITDRVYWVGAIDWTLREFHGYRTQRGSTYNAYLVLADKITLIDTVKAPFFEEMKSRICSVVDPSKIQYIVSNHSEMDHTGSLPRTIEWLKPEKVFASTMGQKALAAHFHFDPTIITPVKETEPLSLGNMTLHFTETRMLHWPDSMFSYLAEDELLFSQDGFGMHLAGEERFVDEVDPSIIDYETAKYYANIIMLYSPMVLKTLAKVAAQNRPIKIIAPDHGPAWRTPDDIAKIMKFYQRWASQEKANKAVIVYDTMWGSTAKMAKVIADSLSENGVKKVSLFCMSASDRSDVITEILEAGGLVVGSPTMNNQMFPTMADVLCYIKGLKPKNFVGGVFGSFGWSGEAVKLIAEQMNEMKIELIGEPVNLQYVPDETGLKACRELAINLAQRIKNNPIF